MTETTGHGTRHAGRDPAAMLALSTAALFWAGNFIAGRALRADVDPVTLNTLRWSLALTLFLPFVGRDCLRHSAEIRRHWRLLLLLGATGIAAFHTTTYYALTLTSASNALLVLALAPVAILVGATAIGAARPTPLQWGGATVSMAGAGILITRGDPAVLRDLAFNRGDLWMLAAVALWATYTLALQRRPPSLPATVVLAASIGFGLCLMLPVLLMSLPDARLSLTPRTLPILGYIVVFPSVLAFWLWGFGVARIGAERAGQFVHLMPVFGPVLAMAILGERIAAAQIAGALVVFAGIAAVMVGGRR